MKMSCGSWENVTIYFREDKWTINTPVTNKLSRMYANAKKRKTTIVELGVISRYYSSCIIQPP